MFFTRFFTVSCTPVLSVSPNYSKFCGILLELSLGALLTQSHCLPPREHPENTLVQAEMNQDLHPWMAGRTFMITIIPSQALFTFTRFFSNVFLFRVWSFVVDWSLSHLLFLSFHNVGLKYLQSVLYLDARDLLISGAYVFYFY